MILGNGNGEVKKKVEALSTTTEQLIKMLAEKDAKIQEQEAKIAQLESKNNTMSKSLSELLELPTIKREIIQRKEKVKVD